MKKIILASIILLIINLNGCYEESILLVKSNFPATIMDNNHTAPVKITLENTSTGADFYQWTFDGGTPSSSKEKNPGTVTYNRAGDYTIRLEAWNDNERDTKEFTFTVDSTVVIGFDTEILMNDFAPAYVRVVNKTEGASSFLWTFEGGMPSTSTAQYPENILFTESGNHTITLQVNNGRETFNYSKTITLKPALLVDFVVEPFFDDYDYEVPFAASLVNKTQSGLTYEWTCSGANIDNATQENTTLSIQSPGTYTITLTVANGQETKSMNKQIEIKENTNLYSVKDVKFGIKSAANTIGYSYALPLRGVLKNTAINQSNGSSVSILFSGLNANFSQCFFVSPDEAENFGFYAIPNASKTYFINRIEDSALSFSSSDFDNMNNDALLRSLAIKTNGKTTGSDWFTNTQIPRFVLFETESGIKGVVKIKAFVSEGNQSYILTDIKHQKTAVQ
jgi:PKD repeat protein